MYSGNQQFNTVHEEGYAMQRRVVFAGIGVLLLAASIAAHAVSVKKEGADFVIETDMYTVGWKTAAQAGYFGGIPKGSKANVLGIGQGRVLYHSANYAGWKDWGALSDSKEIEKAAGKFVMQWKMDDGGSKIYWVNATYWDGVPYWKHELVVEAKADVVSFSDGHEPMVEPRNGLKNNYEQWNDPFPHVAVSNDNGYFALYTEKGVGRLHVGWAPDGRMDLVHDALGKALKKGQKSDPLVYYMALGKGAGKDAHALATEVTKEPTGGLAVSPKGKVATTWALLRAQ
jgi:hypothetical protein